MTAKKYDSSNIDFLPWNEVENGEQLRLFYEPLVKNGSNVYVENSSNQIDLIHINKYVIPVSLGSKMRLKNHSYVYSFNAQYFKYSREEVLKSDSYSKGEKFLAKYGIPVSSEFHRSLKGEDMVFVNGLGLSTGLYPALNANEWKMLIWFLRQEYPKNAIVYRGLNEADNETALKIFEFNDLKAIASRRLLFMDPRHEVYKKKRPYQQDKKSWDKQDYLYWDLADDLSPQEVQLVINYYKELYIDKYSRLNPIYTPDFIINAMRSGVLQFLLLREVEGDKIVGIQAVQSNHQTITTPFIGYDLTAPKTKKYYRFMNHKLMDISISKGLLFNMSSGADSFKEQRGGQPVTEFHYVDYKHLMLVKRKNWELIHLISEKFARAKFESN